MSTTQPQGSSRNRIGLILLVIIVVLGFLAIVLPILLGVSSITFIILTTFVGIFGAFSSFFGAFTSARDAFVHTFTHLPLPNKGFLLTIASGCAIVLLIIIIIQNSIIIKELGQKQPTAIVPLPTHTISATSTLTTAPTQIPTNTPSQPIDSLSSFIPPNIALFIDDHLIDNSKGYQWDQDNEINAQQYRSCLFQEGAYHLKASAQYGIGCNTHASITNITNFVFQIKMIFSQGFNDNSSGAGPTFGVNPQDNSLFYKISINRLGQWAVFTPKDPNSPMYLGRNNYFHGDDHQPNYITIKAFNGKFELQINGHSLTSFSDPQYSGGYLGVLMYAGASVGDVAFSDMRVWKL